MTPFAVLAAQAGLRRFAEFSALRGRIVQSHVIVGANEAGQRLAQRLRQNPHLGTFKGFFDDRQDERLASLPDEQLLGSMADILDYVRLNSRLTQDDANVPERLRALHRGPAGPRVRRMIERPTSWLPTEHGAPPQDPL